MTKNEAISYCKANWGWEQRDATLAANRWALLGDEVIRRIEAEMGAEVLPLTAAEEMHFLACQPAEVASVEPVSLLDRVAMLAASAAVLAGFALPYWIV